MNRDVIATMEAEEAELARKLGAVRQLLAVYRGGDTPASSRGVKTDRSSQASSVLRSPEDRLDKFGPYGQRIVDFADRALPGCNGNPVPTRDLVVFLESQGVNITGNNKVNSLSALLARSSRMRGWGRAGWTRSVSEDGSLLAPKAKERAGVETQHEHEEQEDSNWDRGMHPEPETETAADQ